MEAVTSSPIGRQDMQRFIEKALDELYIEDNTYEVYADRNDNWDELAKDVYESNFPLSYEGIGDMFYERLYEDYYTNLTFEVSQEFRETLHGIIEFEVLDEYGADIYDQLNEEVDNFDEQIEFDFSSVMPHLHRALEDLYEDVEGIDSLEQLAWTRNTDIGLTDLVDITHVGTATEIATYYRGQIIYENTYETMLEMGYDLDADVPDDYDEMNLVDAILLARKVVEELDDTKLVENLPDYLEDTTIVPLNDGVHYAVLYD
jgi:hypothetical protein